MIKLCYYCSHSHQLLAFKTIQRLVAEKEFNKTRSSTFYIKLE